MTHRLVCAAAGAGLLLAATASGQAQIPGSGPRSLQIGPALGLTSSVFSGPDVTGGSLPGSYLGVALIAPLGGAVYLEPQVLAYGTGGRTTAVDSTFGSGERTIRLTYIEVPVLVGLNLPGRHVHPRVFAGAAIGILDDCTQQVTAQGNNVAGSPCASAGISPTSLDFGLTAGGGLTFLTSRGTMSFDLRYTDGLTSIASGVRLKNRTLSLGVEFGLALHRY